MKKLLIVLFVLLTTVAVFILSVQANQSTIPPRSTVDINQATVQKLSRLKGIGEKKAKAIVHYRQLHGDFKSVDELTKVKGIGQKILSHIIKNNSGQLVVHATTTGYGQLEMKK